MKRTLIFFCILICFSASGQYGNADSVKLKNGFLMPHHVDYGSAFQFNINATEFARIQSNGKDTLVITNSSLIQYRQVFNYIRVGDRLFRIVEPKRKRKP